jgi:excisionase family DNA binding protein
LIATRATDGPRTRPRTCVPQLYLFGTLTEVSGPDTWLSTIEASQILGITLRRVYALVESGDLPAHKRGRRLEFHGPEVEALRATAADLAEATRDRDAEKRRALQQARYATEGHATALRNRDVTLRWAAEEHGASLREIAEATGLPTMTVKRIIDRAS